VLFEESIDTETIEYLEHIIHKFRTFIKYDGHSNSDELFQYINCRKCSHFFWSYRNMKIILTKISYLYSNLFPYLNFEDSGHLVN